VATTEWIHRFAAGEFSAIPERFLKGRRDRNDPVYQPLAPKNGSERPPAV
jgi:hypothetical protein